MLEKRQNVFALSSQSLNPMAEAIEKSRMAEVRIDVEARQSLAVMDAETTKGLCALKCLGTMQINTQAQYTAVVRGIEECAAADGLNEQAREHVQDFKDYLEVRSGQHLLGTLESSALNVGRALAQPVMPKKPWWQRLGG